MSKNDTKHRITIKKGENFGDWYSQICIESELISYYEISGCYILRPWSYSLWENLQEWFNKEIKKIGVQNAYFPLFITEKQLNKEQDHINGFAPEVAWVTKSGQSDLEKPLAIRPTSETIMYPYFSEWVKSHRDLPLKLNQWSNVVRWEFKHPTPFIRSREFLWQEGHSAFATKIEADNEVVTILELYRKVYEDILAVPVIKGRKSEKEKFAGGLYTTTVEAFIPSTGKGIQGATAHCLGQNFSKMFDIQFDSENKTKEFVWQNSWGLTTRTLGVMIMIHADDKGLILPPKIASQQVVVIPILSSKSLDSNKKILERVNNLLLELQKVNIRVCLDNRENYTAGWKYNYWELKGVPVRLEIGSKDLEQEQVILVRRDTNLRIPVKWNEFSVRIVNLLEEIQLQMFERAKTEHKSCIEKVKTWDEFLNVLERKHCALVPWCEDSKTEDELKNRIDGVKSLCIPLEQPILEQGTQCFISQKPATCWAIFGRSY